MPAGTQSQTLYAKQQHHQAPRTGLCWTGAMTTRRDTATATATATRCRVFHGQRGGSRIDNDTIGLKIRITAQSIDKVQYGNIAIDLGAGLAIKIKPVPVCLRIIRRRPVHKVGPDLLVRW
jgi:hypothetical protein